MTAWLLAVMLLAASGDGWSNLKHVVRNRPYAVILRDGQCQYGTLSSVGEQGMVLAAYSGLGVLIKRSQIARVTDDPTAPARGVVYSARSSWLDVQMVALKGTEYLHILRRGGDERKWKQPAVSDDSIVFGADSVRKAEVHFIFYVRAKPLTVDEEFLHQQDLNLRWLAGIPWVGDLVSNKISVLLYNSDLPEDNSPIVCH